MFSCVTQMTLGNTGAKRATRVPCCAASLERSQVFRPLREPVSPLRCTTYQRGGMFMSSLSGHPDLFWALYKTLSLMVHALHSLHRLLRLHGAKVDWFVTSLSPETSAWITTLSPTIRSLRVADAPLLSNLVWSFTSTITD